MLFYLAHIMSDATDFSWQNGKAAHAVLLCDMERGLFHGKKHQKLTELGGRMRKNTFKILNLGPKILTPLQAKNHGFINHFRLVYVPSTGIMRLMANGKNIYVQPVPHAEKDCHWVKK